MLLHELLEIERDEARRERDLAHKIIADFIHAQTEGGIIANSDQILAQERTYSALFDLHKEISGEFQ